MQEFREALRDLLYVGRYEAGDRRVVGVSKVRVYPPTEAAVLRDVRDGVVLGGVTMSPIEALADAIMAYEGWKPGSRSYRNRNPGNLRPTEETQARDEKGYRTFPNFVSGYRALEADLTVKCTGQSHTGLGAESSLAQFFQVWAPAADGNLPVEYAKYVVDYLSRALGKPVYIHTTLAELMTMCR